MTRPDSGTSTSTLDAPKAAPKAAPTMVEALIDLRAAYVLIDSDYHPTCESAAYGNGCPGADAVSVSFWRAAVVVATTALESADTQTEPRSEMCDCAECEFHRVRQLAEGDAP